MDDVFDGLSEETRFQTVSEAMMEGVEAALQAAGFEHFQFVLALDVPASEEGRALSATMARGAFADKLAAFEFVMEHATAMAEAIGIRMMAHKVEPPSSWGRG